MAGNGGQGKKSRRLRGKWILAALVLFAVALLSGAATLRFVGLPRFLLARAESLARARGLDLQVERAWISHWNRLTAASVRGHDSQEVGFSFDRVEIGVHFKRHRPFFEFDSMVGRALELRWRPSAGSPAATLFRAPAAEVHFDPASDILTVESSAANLLGAKLALRARIAHPAQFHYRPPSQKKPPPISRWREWIEHSQFDATSAIQFDFWGDAAAETFEAHLRATSRRLSLPGAELSGAQWQIDALRASSSASAIAGALSVSAAGARFSSGSLTNAHVQGTWSFDTQRPAVVLASLQGAVRQIEFRRRRAQDVRVQFEATALAPDNGRGARAHLELAMAQIQNPEGEGQFDNVQLHLAGILPENFSLPNEAEWSCQFRAGRTRWGAAGATRLSGNLRRMDLSEATVLPGFWSRLAPYQLEANFKTAQLQSPKIQVEELQGSLDWASPRLRFRSLDASLYGGRFSGSASLDVPTRKLDSTMDFQCDAHRLAGLLTTNANRWLGEFSWQTPPEVRGAASLILPAWTNTQPRWHQEVLPTITLSGSFSGAGAFRGVPCASATSHFYLTNLFWSLPDLEVRRPEGVSRLNYRWNMDSQEYHWSISSQIFPGALKPLLPENARPVMDEFQFSKAPFAAGEISGRWHRPKEVKFSARLDTRDFSFRGEGVDQLAGTVEFAYPIFQFQQIRASRGTGEVAIARASFDLKEQRIFLTNAVSTFPPNPLLRMIGPHIYADLKKYHFDAAPVVKADGWLPTKRHGKADATFDFYGHDFHYWKFSAPEISGRLRWQGENLSITNLEASFYNGHLSWAGDFDFSQPRGARFAFRGKVKQSDLHLLMLDLLAATNQVAGILNAEFQMSAARSYDAASWEGLGRAELRDGFLWDIPIFGFFSPVLDKISPGLGSSSVSSGRASFTLQKSVVRTDNLNLRSPALRLDYRGSVDLEGNVDARLEAEILRDAWVFGRVFSTVLWPLEKAFEYHLTGTIAHPHSEPVFIPKIFLMPLHPIRSLKRIFSHHSPEQRPALVKERQNRNPKTDAVPAKPGKGVGLNETQ